MHHLSPLPLSCHSPIGRFFCGLTNGEDGVGSCGIPWCTTLIAIRCEYSSVAFKVNSSPWECQHNSKFANTFSKAPSANSNTLRSLPTFFNSSFWDCQHFSKLANTFLTAPFGNANTFTIFITTFFFYDSFSQGLHFFKLANTFLTALSAIANTFLSLPIIF